LPTTEAAKDESPRRLFPVYFAGEGAAGAGAVGDAGAAGRVVDPVVVPGAVLSATRGPLQGAHMNKSAKMKKAAIAAIAAVLMPLPRRSISSRIVFSSMVARWSKPPHAGSFLLAAACSGAQGGCAIMSEHLRKKRPQCGGRRGRHSNGFRSWGDETGSRVFDAGQREWFLFSAFT
jgi:hypothetical protein